MVPEDNLGLQFADLTVTWPYPGQGMRAKRLTAMLKAVSADWLPVAVQILLYLAVKPLKFAPLHCWWEPVQVPGLWAFLRAPTSAVADL